MLLAKVLFVPANCFSVKRAEAFQFFPSYLLPPPSTLFGAFARGLFLLKGFPAPQNEEYAKKMIITITARALTPLSRTGAIIKRLRTLELRGERGETFKPRTDAMVREIISTHKIEAYYLINEDEALKILGNDITIHIKRILYSIDRIGDSESLVSVQSVDLEEVDTKKPGSEVIVNTVLEDDLGEIISGNYIHTMMPYMFDRKRPKGYYIPLSIIEDRTDVYYPSEFILKPKNNALLVKLKDVSIIFR
ncbi:MAG: type I-A CRISPR-associated protein Cas5a [Candidatus Bathyarchaeia archaeon]